MRHSKPRIARNIGSQKSPLSLGEEVSVYRKRGKWHYRGPDTRNRCGDSFIEVSDPHEILELMTRAYQVIYPAHECVDRPNLPCPACEQAGLRALGIRPRRR
jgi:hypothetical protein